MKKRLLAFAAAAATGSVVAAASLGGSDGDAPGAASRTHAKAAVGLTNEVSSNWSGYVATGLGSTATTASTTTSFRNVTATWKQPAATCAAIGRASASAIWVGLGGYSTASTAIEQAGTSADCGADGKATYYAWYELVPEPSITIKNLKIFPGDTVTASVLVTGTEVLMQVKNRTRKTAFTKRVTLAQPDLTSAEWIAEAPSECSSNGFCRQIPLANFGSVTFTKVAALATIQGLGDQGGTITSPLWQTTPIELVPAPQRRYFGDLAERPDSTTGAGGAAPFGLSADGGTFGVTWVANSTTSG
jgi:peptidase A4-like protein